MPRNLLLTRGLQLPLVIAGLIGYWLGGWPAIALHSPDLSSFQAPDCASPVGRHPTFVRLRFPDLTPAQSITLRFPESSALAAPLASKRVFPVLPALSG
jgi:hypothetical protein